MRQNNQNAATSVRPILLVEEELTARERLYDLLTRQGLSVIAVESGERAMALMKHERPGLIVANTKLSDMSGWGLVDRIRSFDANLPIIVLDAGDAAPSKTSVRRAVQAILPRNASEHALLMEIERWRNASAPTRSERWPGTILVVDDEPKVRESLQEFLQSHGFTVATTASGEEALEALKRLSPTAVLLDVKMSGMDGLLALKKIKTLRPNATVIMITGLEEEKTMEEALALGADGYILKPFNLEYLETTLLSKILLGHTS